MEDIYYIVSDGSVMEMESFIGYVYYLQRTMASFSFTDWFCEDDFSSADAFNYVKEIFEK